MSSMSSYAQTRAARSTARCSHVRVTGVTCGSPALADQDFCYYHQRLHEDFAPDFPIIEDAASIQLAILKVLRALHTGMMEYKIAALMLYGLQTASANLLRIQQEARSEREIAAETAGLVHALSTSIPPAFSTENVAALHGDGKSTPLAESHTP